MTETHFSREVEGHKSSYISYFKSNNFVLQTHLFFSQMKFTGFKPIFT
jgi:hypothetical protein